MIVVHSRWYAPRLRAALQRPFVNLVFGARQTGKTTLLKGLMDQDAATYDLAEPGLRTRLLARPGDFAAEVRALAPGTTVFVDEAQNVPSVFGAVQHLYDLDRGAGVLSSVEARRGGSSSPARTCCPDAACSIGSSP